MAGSRIYAVRYVHVQSERGQHVAHVGIRLPNAHAVDLPIWIRADNSFEVEIPSASVPYLASLETLAAELGYSFLATRKEDRHAELMALLARAGVFLAIRVELSHLSELCSAAGYRDFVPALA